MQEVFLCGTGSGGGDNDGPLASKVTAQEVCLHAKQAEVYTCGARFRILVAGRRFGKTDLACAEIVRAATARPNQNLWFVGPQHDQAKRTAWER